MKKELQKKENIKIKCPLCKSKIPSNALRCSKCSGDLNNEEIQKNIQTQLQKQKKGCIATIIVISFFVLLIVISSGGESEPTQDNEKTSNECLDVSPVSIEWIKKGLIKKDDKLTNIKAVKSNDFKNIYFISARIENSTNIITLTMNSITDTGLTLSINDSAKKYFDWLHGDREGAQFYITMKDHGAQESQKCLSTN